MKFENPNNARDVLDAYVKEFGSLEGNKHEWVLYLLHEIALTCEKEDLTITANLIFDVIDIQEAAALSDENDE